MVAHVFIRDKFLASPTSDQDRTVYETVFAAALIYDFISFYEIIK